MNVKLNHPNFYLVFATDMVFFALAHLAAYCIRFDFYLADLRLYQMTSLMLLIVPFKACVFRLFGVYRGMWRYAGVNELLRLLKASVFSSLVIISAMLFIQRFSGFSRAVFVLDGALTFLFVGGLRFCIRLFHQRKSAERWGFASKPAPDKKPVFIVGAGDTGERTLKEILTNNLRYDVKGFIDDDSRKWGQAIHDVPVLGGPESLKQLSGLYGVGEVLVATPSASGAEMRKIMEACEECDLRFKALPSWSELIDGKVSIKAMRDVDYKDLLRRPPVKLDVEIIETYLKEKVILVTGAGGSIGSELCRQIVRFKPKMLILFDASEANLYDIQMEFRHRVGYLHCVPILGDVRNERLLDRVFGNYRPDVVFHAAAYKHVPMLERNPWQAVSNNIRGTRVLMEQAIRHHVGHFVLVSTDKAVRPTNVMGASKRICELLLQALQGNGTHMMAVRFGNVLASSGSVIPLFQKQIARGGPVTVTHPEVTRYFMTIPEAGQLVLQAGGLGQGGEIFILKMGTAVKISEMAHDLIRFSGKEPDVDIQVVYTGLRPGEKLYEELITEGEDIVSTDHQNILVLRPDHSWKGLETQEAFSQWLMQGLAELDRLAEEQDPHGIKEKLRELVPEYKLQESECVL